MYIVEFYKSTSGRLVVNDTFHSFSKKQKGKILKAILNLEEYGISRLIPNLRKLSGTPLWEYRILGKDNIRIICVAIINHKIVILHMFIKKSQKTLPRELKTTLERYKVVIDN